MTELSIADECTIIEAARDHGGYEGRTTLGVGHGETLLAAARKRAKDNMITPVVKAVLEAAGEPVPDVPVVRSSLEARRARSRPSKPEESNEVLRERVRRLEKRVEALETELAWVGRNTPAALS